jgi:hypothetical protein
MLISLFIILGKRKAWGDKETQLLREAFASELEAGVVPKKAKVDLFLSRNPMPDGWMEGWCFTAL